MKTKFKSIILAGVCFPFLFLGCTDWLDIKPLDRMVAQDYWKTKEDVEATMLAAYKDLGSNNFLRRAMMLGEVRSDNVVKGKESDMKEETKQLMDVTVQSTNEWAKWATYYTLINDCNLILHYAPEVAKIDPAYTQGELEVHLAEALTLRALAYFYLVRIYNNVPYVTTPTINDQTNFSLPLTAGDDILKDIVNDLERAENYAVISRGYAPQISSTGFSMNDVRTKTKGRITKHAVRAILADIYLWQASGHNDNPTLQAEEYTKCIQKCDAILAYRKDPTENINDMDMTGAELYLLPNASTNENVSYICTFAYKNSDESIFELQFNDGGGVESRGAFNDYYGRFTLKEGQLNASATVNWITTEDVRMKNSYSTQLSGGTYYILKYRMTGRSEGTAVDGKPTYNYTIVAEGMDSNWILYRLPDVMLMKAEALVELGGENNLQEALKIVNETYMRSNIKYTQPPLTSGTYPSQVAMRKLVLEERQREFLFEGKRWFDLLRVARRENMAKGEVSATLLDYMSLKYRDFSVVKSKLSTYGALFMPVHYDEEVNNPRLKNDVLRNDFYKLADNKK